ncbi:uncharacterized protein [Palaemon carinicauda]|uniref:uncharacterized protein isoform X1 n=1 Tax=Palaemon carinicauda TaxID=392227 RepID=UPI0035B5DBA7
MRTCPGIAGRPCGTFMSAMDTDPHTLCPQCRGRRCDQENKCNECREWSASQWERFGRQRKKKSKRDCSPSGVALKEEGSRDSSFAAQTSSEAPPRPAPKESQPSGSAGPSSVSRPWVGGEGGASHSGAVPPPPPGEVIDESLSNDDLFQIWASLGLKGLPSRVPLIDLVQLGAAVKQSPVIAEVDPLSIIDIVVAEASDGAGQSSAGAVGDVGSDSSLPPSVYPSKGEGSPTGSSAVQLPSKGSALTETPLRRTDGPDDLPRGRLRRKAHRPLRRKGLPSPYKGVKRRLFGSSSSERDSPRCKQPAAPASLDLSVDRSPTPSRPSPSGADVQQPDLVTRRATVPSGQRDSSLTRAVLAHRRSPARQRSPVRQRSPDDRPSSR